MDLKLQIIIAVIILVVLIFIINMIRKGQLVLKYALTWMFVGIGILILDLFPNLISDIAGLMGVGQPINILFFFGFCFALLLIFVLTVTVSKMSVQIKDLAQQVALFKQAKKNN